VPESSNIAEISTVLSKEIFAFFGWHMHPRKDDNFECLDDKHQNENEKAKKTHPTDVVFSYDDPYSPRRVHLLTDLKSYAAKSITHQKIRQALKSLSEAVECAGQSPQWRNKFGVTESEPNEVRGLLFVHNHDLAYQKSFYEELKRVHSNTLPMAPTTILHYLGPLDIQRLYSTANDIMRQQHSGDLPADYGFFYPDLVLKRRHREFSDQPATFESIAGPFLIISHKSTPTLKQGFLIYYNRPGNTLEEFEYLLDSFSRFQLLNQENKIRIRVVHPDADEDLKSTFKRAVNKYARSWGLDEGRLSLLEEISVDRVNAVSASFNPGDMGWD
jgi:hypothetical protein